MKRVKKIKQELVPGGIYGVPLPAGGFGYIKLLFQAPWRDVAKLYDLKSQTILPCAEVLAAPPLVTRLIVAGSGVQSGDWPRIGFEDVTAEEDVSETNFLMGLPPNQQVLRLEDNAYVRAATPDDVARLPDARIHHQYHFEKMLNAR